jgi:hypothetical protein
MNPVYAFLDGKSYKLDGVHGHFQHQTYVDRFDLLVQRLYHIPSPHGKRSKAYLAYKAELRDDWSSDLSDNIERYCAIALELGYTYPGEGINDYF